MNNNRNVPRGTRDILFEEADLLRDIQGKLSQLYKSSGFSEIITPTLEYYDVFKTSGIMREEQMYKLTDPDGRLLSLRADNTTPIARVAATRLANQKMPLKLFYHQNVFRLSSGHTGRKSESAQSGVEILGAEGLQSDLLCLITAIETLEKLSGNYKIEIGHVGFFNALISEYSLDEHKSGEVRKLVNAKDVNKISGLSKISEIPFLFGGEEVFSDAETLAVGNSNAMDALKYLRKLFDALCEAGYKDKVMLDLGIVHSLDYYTGTVFRGYIDGAGVYVLGGGRYDNLVLKFDKPLCATGFGVNMSEVVDTLLKNNSDIKKAKNHILVCFDSHSLKQAVDYVHATNGSELSPINGKSENEIYAAENGYKTLVIFENGTKTEKNPLSVPADLERNTSI